MPFTRWIGALVASAGLLLAAGCSGGTESTPATPSASGRLDETFAAGGTTTTSFVPEDGMGWSAAADVAVQADGKIVTAGYAVIDSPGYSHSFALARYATDGRLDPSFGDGGTVTTTFRGQDAALAVAIQPDGKIVAAGSAWAGSPDASGLALARYAPDGTLDAGFGTGGRVTAGLLESGATAIAVQADGKIVAAGCDALRFALVRLDAEGRLDASFGTGGLVTTDFGEGGGASCGGGICSSGGSCAANLAIQSDGKIVAVGSVHVPTATGDGFALARYLPDGRLDAPFGGGGRVVTSLGSLKSNAYAVAIQADGFIVVGGASTSVDSSPESALARYDPAGRLDPSFGDDGRVALRLGDLEEAIHDLAVQPDGKIVAAGFATKDPGGPAFSVARFDARGRLDATFGDGGARTDVLVGDGNAFAIALQADGKIVAAGASHWGDPWWRFAIARYLP